VAPLAQVAERVEFVHGSFMELFAYDSKLEVDGVFLSPPWCIPDQHPENDDGAYDINCLQPVNGFEMLARARAVSPNVAMCLPHNTNMHQLAVLAAGQPCEVSVDALRSPAVKWHHLVVTGGGSALPAVGGGVRRESRGPLNPHRRPAPRWSSASSTTSPRRSPSTSAPSPAYSSARAQPQPRSPT
jgi:hypothetical protein